MDIIGVVDVYHCDDDNGNKNGQIIFPTKKVVIEYTEIVHRIKTSIDILAPKLSLTRINQAIWDTGASLSCIDESFAKEIGLQPIDTGILVTPHGQKETLYYILDIYLSPDIVIKNVKVTSASLRNHQTDFLIGMDIISKGNFSIKNNDGKTKVEFEYIEK